MEDNQQSEKISKDILTGCAGAAAKLLTGHPFDTIKVVLVPKAFENSSNYPDHLPWSTQIRMQSFSSACVPSGSDVAKFDSMGSAILMTFRKEGVRGFYRGKSAAHAEKSNTPALCLEIHFYYLPGE